MGTVAVTVEKQALEEELAEAQALVEQGEARAALKRAERVRRSALAAEDLPLLEKVVGLAGLVYERTDGKWREEAGRLAFSARQDIRFVGRKQAWAEGRLWIDPFAPQGRQRRPGSEPQQPQPAAPGNGAAVARREPPSLAVSLSVSFLFCAFWALAGVLGAPSLRWWFGWLAVWAVYWLVLALLQLRWRREGYERFSRPVYSWALTAFCALLISIPADFVFVLPLGELARGILFLVAWLACLAVPLIAPRSRRWLLRQWRPYDERPAESPVRSRAGGAGGGVRV